MSNNFLLDEIQYYWASHKKSKKKIFIQKSIQVTYTFFFHCKQLPLMSKSPASFPNIFNPFSQYSQDICPRHIVIISMFELDAVLSHSFSQNIPIYLCHWQSQLHIVRSMTSSRTSTTVDFYYLSYFFFSNCFHLLIFVRNITLFIQNQEHDVTSSIQGQSIICIFLFPV